MASDKGLTPVVGTVVIVAITVAIAIGLSLIINYLANQGPATQTAFVTFTYDDRVHTATVSSGSPYLAWSSLKVTCGGSDVTVPVGNVTAGQMFTCNPEDLFQVVHVSANRVLASHQFT